MTNASNEKFYENTGLLVPRIYLPKKGTDMTRYAVVACDQFTSSGEYWKRVDDFVGDSVSTLRLTLPEYYLDKEGEQARIDKINADMINYLENGTLEPFDGLVFVERTQSTGAVRKGVVIALDLEKYDYHKGSKSLVRATEGTVIERIPPRMKVRKNAAIELPHVLMLINDAKKTVIEGLESAKGAAIYDFDLMEGGGSVKGYAITDNNAIDRFNDGLADLINDNFLYAVGDGNHSFAAAKNHWEELKKQGAPMDHPARFCLCELENINDDGIVFEPIHRVVFDCDIDEFTDALLDFLGVYGGTIEDDNYDSTSVPTADPDKKYHEVRIFSENRSVVAFIDKSFDTLAVGAVQRFLDDALAGKKIDYVHDTDEVNNTVKANKGSLGILLPCPEKSSLFEVVSRGDVLPRKTFSMGDARDKRYYIEARKITM